MELYKEFREKCMKKFRSKTKVMKHGVFRLLRYKAMFA